MKKIRRLCLWTNRGKRTSMAVLLVTLLGWWVKTWPFLKAQTFDSTIGDAKSGHELNHLANSFYFFNRNGGLSMEIQQYTVTHGSEKWIEVPFFKSFFQVFLSSLKNFPSPFLQSPPQQKKTIHLPTEKERPNKKSNPFLARTFTFTPW